MPTKLNQAAMEDSHSSTNHRWWTKGTVAVVTGANKGIGLEIVRQLASEGIHVVLTARDEQRGLAATNSLHHAGLPNVGFHQLDVQNPASVAAFATWMNHHYPRLDILVNNAAVLGAAIDSDTLNAKGIDPSQIFSTTASKLEVEGYCEDYELAEMCIDINYYGTKRTIEALLPLLKLSGPAGARIVNVSSGAGLLRVSGFDPPTPFRSKMIFVAFGLYLGQHIPSEDLRQQLSNPDNLTEEKVDSFLQSFLQDFREGKVQSSGWPTNLSAYYVSKAALNAYTRILARQLPNMCVNCVHPGFVKTDITLHLGEICAEEGAEAPVMVALLPPGGPSGQYFNLKEIAEF